MRCSFVPPYVLQQLANAAGLGRTVDPDVVVASRETLVIDAAFRERRQEHPRAGAAGTGGWVVHTADHGMRLPGTPVRSQDEPAAGDDAVDEAWVGIEAVLAMFRDVYGRASYDDADARVIATVHHGQDYDNAFWDGTQLVFGDGDGRIFDRFTKPVDVLGHEFTHAVTEYTAGLVYQGQPGALNESVSDVFASCMKQRLLGQTADEGDWLIGAGLLLPGINGRGLRSMSEPGSAYDDPLLGKDPQAGHMDGYIDTTDDNGGVHLNSGIPNHAFQLAAVAIGGSAAEGAGKIWYAALQAVDAEADFAAFAAATVAAAGDHADAVGQAWSDVGVEPGAPNSGGGSRGSGAGGERSANVVEVRRSGGFAGLTTSGTVDLDADDPRAAEARSLVHRIDFRQAKSGLPHPDGYVYEFRFGDAQFSVPEQHVSDDLRRLADLALDQGRS